MKQKITRRQKDIARVLRERKKTHKESRYLKNRPKEDHGKRCPKIPPL